jgi:hypothetical protein
MPSPEYRKKHREELCMKERLRYKQKKEAKLLRGEIEKKYGKLGEIFWDWTNYKRLSGFPNATFEQYLKALSDKKRQLEIEDQDQILGIPPQFQIGKYPLPLNKRKMFECMRFRSMYSGLLPKEDPLWCNEHMLNCESCMAWKHANHPSEKSTGKTWQGLNLWDDTPREPSEAEKRDKENNQIMQEEMKKDYGREF